MPRLCSSHANTMPEPPPLIPRGVDGAADAQNRATIAIANSKQHVQGEPKPDRNEQNRAHMGPRTASRVSASSDRNTKSCDWVGSGGPLPLPSPPVVKKLTSRIEANPHSAPFSFFVWTVDSRLRAPFEKNKGRRTPPGFPQAINPTISFIVFDIAPPCALQLRPGAFSSPFGEGGWSLRSTLPYLPCSSPVSCRSRVPQTEYRTRQGKLSCRSRRGPRGLYLHTMYAGLEGEGGSDDRMMPTMGTHLASRPTMHAAQSTCPLPSTKAIVRG